MDWKSVPEWKLTVVQDSTVLRISKQKQSPTKHTHYQDTEIALNIYKCGSNVLGYELQSKQPHRKLDCGWYTCFYFEVPQLVEPVVIYADENIRIVRISKNFVFAIRWKQKQQEQD